MSAGFSGEIKELVRSRTDLVALVGETLSLTRRGHEYVGLCPFHDDHNPSLRVYPERQSYRCWVCDEGGDCFSWLMKTENVSFPEALEVLARRAQVDLPHRSRPAAEARAESDRGTLHEVCAWAEQLFHDTLLNAPEAEPARNYLADRGITADSISRFRLGYHPNDWNWIQNRARGRFSPKLLLEARLIGERRESQGCYDCFVDRVLFPIHDERSRCVGFGGRVLPGSTDDRKYWNSPESPVFAKSRLVYALHLARDEIRRTQTALVMEGYTDCLLAHQCGVTNAVGTLGTALTESHVSSLKRFARRVVLVYDGDDAGMNAAERAILRFLAQDVDLRVLTLPGKLDPADFLLEHGVEEFQRLANQATEGWEHKLRQLVKRYGMSSVDSRERVLTEMLEFLAQAPRFASSFRRDIILGNLAQRSGLPEHRIRERLSSLEARRRAPAEQDVRRTRRIDSEDPADGQRRASNSLSFQKIATKDDKLECELLEILLTAPETVQTIRQQVEAHDFRNPALRQVLELCFDLTGRGLDTTADRLLLETEEPELKRVVVALDEQARLKQSGPELLAPLLAALHHRRERQSLELSTGQIALSGGGTNGLDHNAKTLLRMATEFHQKRANQNSTSK